MKMIVGRFLPLAGAVLGAVLSNANPLVTLAGAAMGLLLMIWLRRS